VSPRKRANGTGSIYQRKDGKWVAAIPIGPSGRRRNLYAPTRELAEDRLRIALRAQDPRAADPSLVLELVRAKLAAHAYRGTLFRAGACACGTRFAGTRQLTVAAADGEIRGRWADHVLSELGLAPPERRPEVAS